MNYQDELRDRYTHPIYTSWDSETWIRTIIRGNLSHAMVMSLVSERDALRAELDRYRARVTELTEKLNENYEPLRKELERLGLENAQTEYGYSVVHESDGEVIENLRARCAELESRLDIGTGNLADITPFPLIAEITRLREAASHALKFIENGIEFGYITMPDPGDSALDVAPMLRAALAGKDAQS